MFWVLLYLKIYKKEPYYSHLKVFGCQASMSVHEPDKLAPRAISTIFLD